MPKVPDFKHSCHRCGTAFNSIEPDDGSNCFCPACLTQNLREVERSFFEDYIYFGAKARSTSARVYLNLFESTDDVRLRKFAGLSIYEQFILATEDLSMVYFALRNREQKPLLDTLLGFELTAKTSSQWERELPGGDDDVLEQLGLLKNGVPVGWVATIEPARAVDALRKAVGDMRAAAHHRTVDGGVMVKSFNKLKHGFVAVARGDFVLQPNAKRAEWVTTLMVNRQLGRLVYGQIEVTKAKLNEFIGTIESAAAVSAMLLLAYLRSTGSTPSAGAPSAQ